MTLWRIAIFLLVALIQIALPASTIRNHLVTLKSGREWKFRTAPVDPVDAFRGRYVSLRFAAEESAQPNRLKTFNGQTVYVLLKNGPDGFAQIDRLSAERVTADDAFQAELGGWLGGKQTLRFPFDQFWMEETRAPAAEKAYAQNSRLAQNNSFVTVRIHKGHTALEQLYINGKPIAEYLRSHPQK